MKKIKIRCSKNLTFNYSEVFFLPQGKFPEEVRPCSLLYDLRFKQESPRL